MTWAKTGLPTYMAGVSEWGNRLESMNSAPGERLRAIRDRSRYQHRDQGSRQAPSGDRRAPLPQKDRTEREGDPISSSRNAHVPSCACGTSRRERANHSSVGDRESQHAEGIRMADTPLVHEQSAERARPFEANCRSRRRDRSSARHDPETQEYQPEEETGPAIPGTGAMGARGGLERGSSFGAPFEKFHACKLAGLKS